MVVALILLSLAMIVGGSLAALAGWDIVLTERGWTMVIAGSAVASGGALLLGLAAVAARLGRIRTDLAAAVERLGRGEAALPALPALDPVAAVSSGLLAGGPAAAAEPTPAPPDDEAQPSLPLFMREPKDEPRGELPPGLMPEQRVEIPGDRRPPPEPALVPPDGPEDRRTPAGDDTPAGPDLRDAGGPEAPRVEAPRVYDRKDVRADASERDRDDAAGPGARPEREEGDEPKPEEDEEAGEPGAPATVIGTYKSGDNRYIMYSDGSIEAETPTGTFRFGSLDELKEFIAAGGEGGSP